jgi:hypothetical protein
MIIVRITEEQKERAKKHYDFEVLKGSISNGEGNIYGALGEIILLDHLKKFSKKVSLDDTYDYDIGCETPKGLAKIEVKSKKTSVVPHPSYFCTVYAQNIAQQCHFYAFVRISGDLNVGYILGYIPRYLFLQQAMLFKKGNKDSNGFVFPADCYNLPIYRLFQFKK